MLKQKVGSSWTPRTLPELPEEVAKAAEKAAARLVQGIGCSDTQAHNQLIAWAEATDIILREDLDSLAGRNLLTSCAPHSWFHISNITAALGDFTVFMDAVGRGLDNPFREQEKELSAWLKEQNDQLK